MNKFQLTVGILFVVLGVAALIHPEVKMPAKQREIYVASQKLIINTQRIVTVPGWMSGIVIIAGCGLAFLGTRKS